MGTSASALPEVAVLAVRATGPVLATSAFLNGRYGYSWMLFALAHFVILLTLGVPALTDGDATWAALVTYPLVGLGAAVLSMLNFYLLRLAELVPMTRTFAKSCGMNFGPRPSGGYVLANFLIWAVVAIGADLAFEWFYSSDAVLGLIIELVVIVVGYAAALLLHLFVFDGEKAIYGGDSSAAVRSILVPGIYHLVIELIVGIVLVVTFDNNWAWISAVIVLGVGAVVTLAIWFLAAKSWKRLPRTGDMTTFAMAAAVEKAPAAAASAPLVSLEEEGEVEETEELKSRFNTYSAPVYRNVTNATVPMFNQKKE